MIIYSKINKYNNHITTTIHSKIPKVSILQFQNYIKIIYNTTILI